MSAGGGKLRVVPQGDGLEIAVKVTPGASRSRVVGILGDALKIAVSAPPHDGQANAAVVQTLAAFLDISASRVKIVAGHAQPRKRVMLEGVSGEVLSGALARLP